MLKRDPKADPDKNHKGQKVRGFHFRKTITSIISNACGSRRKNGEAINKCSYDQPKGNMGKILQELERELRGKILIDETRNDENDKKNNGLGIKGVKTISTGYPTVNDNVKNSEEKLMRKDVQEEGIGELELCKKRILMGEKCRPLNLSGVLHYDDNGVFVPEDFSSK